MKLRLVVAVQSTKFSGPILVYCLISGSKQDYDNGHFYDAAKRVASEHSCRPQMVAFDENDMQVRLFFNFDKQVIFKGKVTDEDRKWQPQPKEKSDECSSTS